MSAKDSYFFEAPMTMDLLGAVDLGAANRENHHLTEPLALAALQEYAASGGGTIVDVTAPDQGRDPAGLRRLARATGVTIIMGTGPRETGATSEGSLADEMIGELTRADLPAGLIGRLEAPHLGEKTSQVHLRAAANAAAQTGAPVLLDLGPSGHDETLHIFSSAGVNPEQLAFTGLDDLIEDPPALLTLAESGAYLQFDGIGRLTSLYGSWDYHSLAATLNSLISHGFGPQILLAAGMRRRTDLRAYGGGGLTFLSDNYGPFLGFMGINEENFTQLTTDNPQRFLTTSGQEARA